MGLLASKRRHGALGAALLAVPVGGLIVGLAVSGSVRGQTSAAQADAGFIPRATVVEIMDAMVMPAADVLWNAVGVSVTSEGVIENVPETDEDWQRLRWAAITMAEGANALLVPGRKVAPAGTVQDPNDTALSPDQIEARIAANRAAWVGMAHVLDAAVVQALDAIEARDADTLSEVGGTIDAACESCHLQFWYPEQ
jgi:cytochrome c556